MSDINVAFTSTGYGPMWSPCVASWLRVVGFTARQFQVEQLGQIGGAGITDRLYTHSAENRLVLEMLHARPKFTHLFMTEMDMILPHDVIVKLMALDKDMTSGVYFLRADLQKDAGQPCLYKRAPIAKDEDKGNADYMHAPIKIFPQDQPFQVDCAGLGCMLIKRHVFEKMPYPWFDMAAGSKYEYGYGSDIYFSKHAKDHGFELWIDPTVQCGQIDYYVTDLSDYKWQLDNDPKFASRGYIIGHGGNRS
jgi:hypothetical protein